MKYFLIRVQEITYKSKLTMGSGRQRMLSVLLPLLLSSAQCLEIAPRSGGECGCDIIKFTSQNPYILRKYEAALGLYNRVAGVEVGGRAVWLHNNENYFLYFSNASAMWAVGEVLGGDEATIENLGDTDLCPDQVRSSWSLEARLGAGTMYDETMAAVCMTGPCGGQYCGHMARCDPDTGQCACRDNYTGDPRKRCYPNIGSLCNCREVSLKTTNQDALRNQGDSFGSYYLHSLSGGYPVYQHQHGHLYLYQQDGSWLVSNMIGSRAGGVQNQGDPSMCPYRFKTSWEYADVARAGWQWSYDYSASMVCAEDGCSVTKCGHRATCTHLGMEASCSCDIGFDGNPYRRCYPVEVPGDCSCTRISVSSEGEAAATQSDKMGLYYLYGYHDGKVVYQHQSGLEYLFHAHGQAWAIGAQVGGLRVGVINFSNSSCPYTARETPWKYSTQGTLDEDPSLRVECDRSSVVQNPILAASERSTAAPAVTTSAAVAGEQLQSALRSYVQQLHTAAAETTLAAAAVTEPSGIFSVPTGDKGIIKVAQLLEERPTKIQDLKLRNEEKKIPESFFDQLSNTIQTEDQESGESYSVYLVTTSTPPSPASSQLHPNYFETSKPRPRPGPGARTPRTPTASLLPTSLPRSEHYSEAGPSTARATTKSFQHFLNQLGVTARSKPAGGGQRGGDQQTLHPAYTSLPINYDKTEGRKIVNQMMEKLEKQKVAGVTAPPRRTTTEPSTRAQLDTASFSPSLRHAPGHAPAAQEAGLAVYRGPCNCSKIIMSSNNPTTLTKHGAELGQYTLVGGLAGRPVYRHVSRSFYLFYQPESGGNWLVNTRPGLMYGGIQNSKDYPQCPYLVSTVWQYGDSEVGGWVYDQSLTVTCPANTCSVLKCGFRAECVAGEAGRGGARCECKAGFRGDPYTRCYPAVRQSRCGCNHLEVSSVGPARLHQRDKMGGYFLWGYYNDHPVYQHYSGLDFLYFHANQVWGVGPKVGGKRAGLLNFAAVDCPYEITSPWQFGTKLPDKGRQLDTHLTVKCVTN